MVDHLPSRTSSISCNFRRYPLKSWGKGHIRHVILRTVRHPGVIPLESLFISIGKASERSWDIFKKSYKSDLNNMSCTFHSPHLLPTVLPYTISPLPLWWHPYCKWRQGRNGYKCRGVLLFYTADSCRHLLAGMLLVGSMGFDTYKEPADASKP